MVEQKGFPRPDEAVVRYLLQKHASEQPNAPFIKFDDETEWTFAGALEQARRAAAGLEALGVRRGDHVLVWLPNGSDAVRAWLGINFLGAIYIAFNTAYRGALLDHVVELADAKVGIVHGQLLPRLADASRGSLADIIVIGECDFEIPALHLHPEKVLIDGGICREPGDIIQPWDNMFVVFTSGTTGPSKAVLCPYAQLWSFYADSAPSIFGRERRLLVTNPMYHSGGIGMVYGQLLHGGFVSLASSFKTSEFWNRVRRDSISSTGLLGATIPFLLSVEEGDDEIAHSLTSILAVPYSREAREFADRFGVDVYTCYGMSEISLPLVSEANPEHVGVAGRLRPGQQMRIVDENDLDVPVGEVGEALVRCDMPWMMFNGYYRNPEATANSLRNCWFHTGDRLRKDAEGNYFFVERQSDRIRRRGENMSSYDIEQEVASHPAVQEVAAFSVASDVTEDEVMVCISFKSGKSDDPAEIIRFLLPRMPHYMIPRYIRIVDDFPRTETHRIKKYILKEQGITSDTWDREQAGLKINRDRLKVNSERGER
jgi:crotonobetaine/carnitine-CoA ligase